MTILVTGSAGHLGEALVRSLRAEGRAALGVDALASPFTDRVGSICDRKFVRSCMKDAGAVLHAATLHKPHVATHREQEFVDVNVTGTLCLLEAALEARVASFVFTSTTSAFGAALSPAAGAPAAWIDEAVASIPKNIYGATKVAAEGLCELFARRDRLPVVVLRAARFFPEGDDDPDVAGAYGLDNAQANELLYRRVDVADVVLAHSCALEKAGRLRFARAIICATTPFAREHLPALRHDAAAVVASLYPEFKPLYAAAHWRFFPRVDRVYDNAHARAVLDWAPRHDFRHVLDCLATGRDFRSPLARAVGTKGYHRRAGEAG